MSKAKRSSARNGRGSTEKAATSGRKAAGKADSSERGLPATADNDGAHNGAGWFTTLAHGCAHWAGKPVTFLACVALVLIWAASGPIFGYSDTWQLVINTSTTIVTFLMVFLIQNTQNRDTLAIQVKLAELIWAVQGAENRVAAAEDMSEQELQELHKKYHALAEQTLTHLETRQKKH
jgi:low affinity Fe/Cu permease